MRKYHQTFFYEFFYATKMRFFFFGKSLPFAILKFSIYLSCLKKWFFKFLPFFFFFLSFISSITKYIKVTNKRVDDTNCARFSIPDLGRLNKFMKSYLFIDDHIHSCKNSRSTYHRFEKTIFQIPPISLSLSLLYPRSRNISKSRINESLHSRPWTTE